MRLRPVHLGILLGIANVVANAILFGFVEDPRAVMFVGVYGIVPGIIAGAIIGALAGATKHGARLVRTMLIMAPAALVVALLGALFGALDFVPYALVPTFALCAVLERNTYKPWPDPSAIHDVDVTVDPYAHLAVPQRSGVKLSMFLGAAVMLIVMIGVSQSEPSFRGFYEAYIPWGASVGIALALPFGVLADCTQERPIWFRRALLLIAGVGLTAALGVLTRMHDLIAIASIPVAAGCLFLERYSRSATLVPAAFARS
jgi:hypothetical protein